ncbi:MULTISPECIES: sensor histidine kinase KdpD [unclassified Streptomyces]|uniref:Signal transduction histidine-protein kinase/phosphatase MprB n=1 Tax=Streptomyces sp. NBC_00119 TaxID=2975659 RepID=A0AAU1TZK5_9ACTN|nr:MULTISPECIES: HAMP domain-containing sensor histidine kinase [unclassified Streptomyces]MCX4648425.1 HAMP domain-containing histidine kinase [Streptomyces sp. NBC_01446]MCX5323458.1 HAMP domain-containing histidine kinase [Streptomyces sp. NBC_00120]
MNRLLRRLAPRTLRGRLSLVALTTAALLMAVLTVAFNTVMDRHLQHQADDELRNRAAAVATTIDTSGPRVRVLETVNDHLLDANAWIYAGTRVLEQPPATTADSTLARAAGQLAAQRKRTCSTVNPESPHAVRLCSDLVGNRHGATVVTALDLGPYRSSADTLLLGSLILDAVMLACTYALTRLAVGRALRPVRTMTDQATQWSAVASDERFGVEGHPVELARLGTSLDTLLDRIRTVLRHEQQLTGELSHELRTPLTRIVIELDWWKARPRTAAETRATHGVIVEAAQSMRTICDTLLSDARDRAQNSSAAPGTTTVVPVLHRLVESFDAREHVQTSVDVADPGLQAGVAPALLERIVSPLLTNAVRFAVSAVTVSARQLPGRVRIDVTDDGPGVPAKFVGDLFQPGRRADLDDGHDGAGLGLPLARRLARAVGGEVSHDPGYTSGARFRVDLPVG